MKSLLASPLVQELLPEAPAELESFSFLEDVVIDCGLSEESGGLGFMVFFSGQGALRATFYIFSQQFIAVDACSTCGLGAEWLERREFQDSHDQDMEKELACCGCGQAYIDFLLSREPGRLPVVNYSEGDEAREKLYKWASEELALDPLSATVLSAEILSFASTMEELAALGRTRFAEAQAAVDSAADGA